MSKANFKAFDPVHVAELAINYLKNMTDDANDYLPYWLVLPHKKPAEAAHCRIKRSNNKKNSYNHSS